MKKRVFALLTLCCLLLACLPVSAASEGSYLFESTDGGVAITGYTGKGGDITLPETLGGQPVVAIGEAAFYGCSALTGVTMPAGIRSIAAGAFAECAALAHVTMPDGLAAIGDYAFQNTAVRSLSIPAGVRELGSLITYGCTKLEAFSVAPGNTVCTAQDGVLFDSTLSTLLLYPLVRTAAQYTVPASVKTLATSCFQDQPYLEEITLPDGLEQIEDWVFHGCRQLRRLAVPDSVTTLGYGLCDICPNLEEISIGNGVTFLPYRTFQDCAKLQQVALGTGLRTLDTRAFYNCSSLESVVLPDGLERIEDYAFWGCTALHAPKLPDSLAFIGGEAFKDCESLGELTVPGHLTRREDGAWVSLISVTLSGRFDYTMAFEVLEETNRERTAAGLAPLVMDRELLEAAMKRAAECSLCFEHTRPDGSSCFFLTDRASRENIAAGNRTAESVVAGWMDSPGHRANILSSDTRSIGVGCFRMGAVYYWVQMFGTVEAEPVEQPADHEASYTTSMLTELAEPYAYVYPDVLQAGETAELVCGLRNPGWDAVYATLASEDWLFSSNNPTVATVDREGRITGVGFGTATITLRLADCPDRQTAVTISVIGGEGSGIVLTPASLILDAGSRFTLHAEVRPADSVISWQSDNPAVATVDGNGQIIAVAAGTAHITASLTDSSQAVCTITVLPSAVADPDLLGDINGDGQINTTDARLALQYAVEKITLTESQQLVGDVDASRKVDTTDARLILQYAVEKIHQFPAEK